MRWEAIILGAIVAYAIQLGLGVALAGVASPTPVTFTLSGFLSLLIGGLVAARAAGRQELLHGALVAVPFILVGELLRALGEMELAGDLPLAIPRLNIGGLIIGDLILLAGAAAGGWLYGVLGPGRKEA